jgi:hypothetical protein
MSPWEELARIGIVAVFVGLMALEAWLKRND